MLLLTLTTIFVAIIFGLIRGGKIKNLESLNFKFVWLGLTGFFIQVLITSSYFQKLDAFFLSRILYLISNTLIIIFFVVNWLLPGVPIIILGLTLNLITILLNGGVMPVSLKAAQRMGIAYRLTSGAKYSSEVISPQTRLPFLADFIPIPRPFSEVVSPGDFLILVGIFILVHFTLKKSQLNK